MLRKKVLMSSVIAFLLAAFITGDSLASFTGNRLGKISTRVTSNLITFTTLSGGTKTFLVSSSTTYFGINGFLKSYSYLQKGRYVDAIGQVGWPAAPSGVMSATTVILLPDTINTTEWNNARDYGKVTSVNRTANTFVLSGRYGSVTYKVNSSTDFVSNVAKISDLRQGMRALIAFNSSTHVVLAIVAFFPQ